MYVLSVITHPPPYSSLHTIWLLPIITTVLPILTLIFLPHPFSLTPSPPHTPQEDEEDSGEEVDLSKYDLTGDDDEEEEKGNTKSKEESKWVACVHV